MSADKRPKKGRLPALHCGGWLGSSLFVMAFAVIVMAVASVGNSVKIERLRAEVAELRATVAAMQNMPQQSPRRH
jgi:hypothetical protein